MIYNGKMYALSFKLQTVFGMSATNLESFLLITDYL